MHLTIVCLKNTEKEAWVDPLMKHFNFVAQNSLRGIHLSSDNCLMAGVPKEGNEVGVWSVAPFGSNPSDHFTLPHPTKVTIV